jgi:hypothetical protein
MTDNAKQHIQTEHSVQQMIARHAAYYRAKVSDR